eukprot:NODE_450_length_8384_cov_0.353530.p2 type:complete len:473 gc:universal NODE_450_length_8384_cov_0.353530:4791-3373(-)
MDDDKVNLFTILNPRNMGTTDWSLTSYKSLPAQQQVEYKDKELYESVLKQIKKLPPLVHPEEIENLKEQLQHAASGKKFILHGGDCAETFDECQESIILAKLKVLLQMSLVISFIGKKPVIKIGRIAGQYAKPRSNPTEVVNGVEVLTYRGDNINCIDAEKREPDPNRLLLSHFSSSSTLNYIRGVLNSGFADLHKPDLWNFDFVVNKDLKKEYQKITDQILDALGFLSMVGADGHDKTSTYASKSPLATVDFFTSHEGLHLNYEEMTTKQVGNHFYDLSAHILWIGDRTRQLDQGHVEFFRGINNPIGIKVGPTTKPDELVQLLGILNPDKIVGKIVLITRFGKDKVNLHLPNIIKAVQAAGRTPCWICDPMHGNTISSSSGKKTRMYSSIVEEISITFTAHSMNNSILSGIHLEMTGSSVTECVGGSMQLGHEDLLDNYKSNCDPRLNYEQSLDIAFMVAKFLKHSTFEK